MAITVKKSLCNNCIHRDVCLYRNDFGVAEKKAMEMIAHCDDAFIQHIFNISGLGRITCSHFRED